MWRRRPILRATRLGSWKMSATASEEKQRKDRQEVTAEDRTAHHTEHEDIDSRQANR